MRSKTAHTMMFSMLWPTGSVAAPVALHVIRRASFQSCFCCCWHNLPSVEAMACWALGCLIEVRKCCLPAKRAGLWPVPCPPNTRDSSEVRDLLLHPRSMMRLEVCVVTFFV